MRRRRIVLPLALLAAALGTVFRAPLAEAVHTVCGGVFRTTASAAEPLAQPSYEELREENARLTTELTALRRATAENAVLREENARLLQYFSLRRIYPELTLLPASLLMKNPREEGFTLGAGTALGVKSGDAVVTESGLVGRVVSADAVSCRVSTLLSPQTRVSVRDAATGDVGILAGDGEGLRMTLLAEDSRVAAGDLVVTSGEGGVYPENLVVGTVAAVGLDDYDASKYAEVTPAADAERLTDAAVVTAFTPKGVARDG